MLPPHDPHGLCPSAFPRPEGPPKAPQGPDIFPGFFLLTHVLLVPSINHGYELGWHDFQCRISFLEEKRP